MKKRIVSLLLAVLLVVSALSIPVSAASAKDVYNYLKDVATHGEYDSAKKEWFVSLPLNENGNIRYGVFYLESDKYVEARIYDSTGEITWRISSNPSPAYNVFVRFYDENATGTVSLTANYNGADFTSFKSFSGSYTLKSGMLNVLNTFLPGVIELTRAMINEGGYKLADLGLTGYKKCTVIHAFDTGKVTKQPTCVDAGTMVYTCVVCGATDTKSIPATGKHTWDKGVEAFPPTCTETGVKYYTCTVCQLVKDEAIPALGHSWTLDETLSDEDLPHGGTARYRCTRCGEIKKAELCAAEIFTDMPKKSHWAHDAIDWAYFNGITGGTSATTFSPNKVVTRGEVVTFLHTLKGKPEAEAENPFTDVKKKDFYYNAVLWAVENGITKGTTETTFSPKNTCSRAEIVMFLWAAAGRPEPENTENKFADVKAKDYFRTAVLWAVENNITGGVDETHFGPKVNCTRAQVMLFLKAAYPILTAEETPEDPVDPVDPVDPTDPTDPTDPVDPIAPEDPSDPTEP